MIYFCKGAVSLSNLFFSVKFFDELHTFATIIFAYIVFLYIVIPLIIYIL
ncbi:hypothetical protein COI_1658 [Mannheimia haemolytica serotype A2 str. OVINE]|nr:hypothetical protein COI_1658 [Mannheimia haemolytica serotype A2 str. OVINE]EEY12344.1 hypothetical protein COK_1578 [Mannheimia haemolytica serotype A2 str. BOVINE]